MRELSLANFVFFFAAAPQVTLRVTPRGAAARRKALLRSARHRCAVRDAYGARHMPETGAYGHFLAPAARMRLRGSAAGRRRFLKPVLKPSPCRNASSYKISCHSVQ